MVNRQKITTPKNPQNNEALDSDNAMIQLEAVLGKSPRHGFEAASKEPRRPLARKSSVDSEA